MTKNTILEYKFERGAGKHYLSYIDTYMEFCGMSLTDLLKKVGMTKKRYSIIRKTNRIEPEEVLKLARAGIVKPYIDLDVGGSFGQLSKGAEGW